MPKILIIDPDLQWQQTIKDLLTCEFEFFSARNGRDGLAIFEAQLPEFVITEVMLAYYNGWELGKMFRTFYEKKNKTGLLVCVTSIGSALNRLTSPIYGFDFFFDKPLDDKELERLRRCFVK